MKMRRHKHNVMVRMNPWGLWPVTPLILAFREGIAELNQRAKADWVGHNIPEIKALADDIEEAKMEYVCLRLKDHVVVDTFDTREEALELVKKHIRGKKAKLYVTTSLGETVVFNDEELA